MPAAIGLEVIVGLAFALAAISMLVLVRELVVKPIRASANGVSGIPAIGGALAWLLVHLADQIEVFINASAQLSEWAKMTALNWFNYGVQQAMTYLDVPQWHQLNAASAQASAALQLVNYVWLSYLPWLRGLVEQQQREIVAATQLTQQIWYAELPKLWAWQALAEREIQTSLTIGNDILNRELPRLAGIEEGVRTDLGVLRNALDEVIQHVIPRIQADVGTRARAADVDTLRAVLEQQRVLLATLAALAPIALAGVDSIGNLRCMMDLPCAQLNPLLDSDLEARVSLLEVGSQ